MPNSAVTVSRQRPKGQSLVEFALVLPIILLLVMVSLDFGRVYLGWINIQNMSRIAANFAANNPTADWAQVNAATITDPLIKQYRNQILNDARATNCALPVASGRTVVAAPGFADTGSNGSTKDIGDTASVGITCNFAIITPIIGRVFGNSGSLPVSAAAVFPVKSGLSATAGGGGGAPVAQFAGDPITGFADLTVQFNDLSSNLPTLWAWDFENDGVVDETLQNPQHTYTSVGLYTVKLIATNAIGSSTETKTSYIAVNAAPPGVAFTADRLSGPQPLDVNFTDQSTGSPTAWSWNFGDGSPADPNQNPTHRYSAVGTYTVTLTVTNAGGNASLARPNYISVSVPMCTVPNYANTSSSAAQGTWNGAGFTTTVQFQQGGLPWTIMSQNIVVGLSVPCNSVITVSKN